MESKDGGVTDNGITCDVFSYIFSYFLCIWRQIRGVVNVRGRFCIVFIWVVVIQFYPKSCNLIGVLSLFSEIIFEYNIKWRKFIWSFKALIKERRKRGRKLHSSHKKGCFMRPYAWSHAPGAWAQPVIVVCFFSKPFLVETPYFHSINL